MCMYTFGLMVCRGILRSYSKVVIFIFTYAIRANLKLSWGSTQTHCEIFPIQHYVIQCNRKQNKYHTV